jgi:hypothetical protein
MCVQARIAVCVRAIRVCYIWVLSAAAAANTTVVLRDCLSVHVRGFGRCGFRLPLHNQFLQVLGVVLLTPLQPGATPDHCRGVSCPLLLADTARGVQQIRLVGSSCAACLSTKAVYDLHTANPSCCSCCRGARGVCCRLWLLLPRMI